MVEVLSYKPKINEDMVEKVDYAKYSNSPKVRGRTKQKFADDTLYGTTDAAPYRGYGFAEVHKYTLIFIQDLQIE